MKTKSRILSVLFMSSLNVVAQPAIVGTWELVSMKGTNFAGQPTFVDASIQKVIKIITPTHYMLIAHDVKGDSLVFNRSHAGDVILDGTRYIETMKSTSWENLIPTACVFYWKVDGDKLIKYGSIAREDGKTATQEMMVFKRVDGTTSYPDNPAIGTWDQLSSSFTLPDGKKGSHTRETASRFEIFSPTHWFRISHFQGKFESAMGGTYKMEGDEIQSVMEVASFYFDPNSKAELRQRVEGDKRFVTGKFRRKDGKTMVWEDVFQKVDGVVAK